MTDPETLVAAARTAARRAYAPYSRFQVGAALLLDDGRIVTGCNMENASYGLSLCAEAVALGVATSQGDLARIVAVAVAGGADEAGTTPVRPCGRCRQLLVEAAQLGGRDPLVHCTGLAGGEIESHRLGDLLPLAFGPADLT